VEDPTTPTTQLDDNAANERDLPPGNHPLEVAARRGFGPLSPHAEHEWHGQARPCVSCGQLVLRNSEACDFCEQDMRVEMLEKMRAHSGPWYVLEHVRPFPGINLERIIRQIRRGLITETSIVRGPATEHQWRFAGETPGLCRYFGKCWQCREAVSASDAHCPHCMSFLSFEQTRPVSPLAASPMPASQLGESRPPIVASGVPEVEPVGSENLRQLSAALNQSYLPPREPIWDEPPRVGGIRATWIAAGLLVMVVLALLWFTSARTSETAASPTALSVKTKAFLD
jgi:hypothetical protein